MNKRIAAVFICALCLSTANASASLIFDNGAVDPTNTTWNTTGSTHFVFDDFILYDDTVISSINFSLFMPNQSAYLQTNISIYDGIGLGANLVVPEFSITGSLTPNGMITANTNVPNGFDVYIDGLSLDLLAGTYFLGIQTDTAVGTSASIGSGNGNSQTLGEGLYQGFFSDPALTATLRRGDHMSFQLYDTAAPVPEPSTFLLLGSGLFGLAWYGRKRKKA